MFPRVFHKEKGPFTRCRGKIKCAIVYLINYLTKFLQAVKNFFRTFFREIKKHIPFIINDIEILTDYCPEPLQ
jgi:hypothetical protein